MVDFPNPIVRAKNGSFTKADTCLENELLSGEAIALSLVNKSELCVHDIVTGIYIFVVKFLIHCNHLKKKKKKKGHYQSTSPQEKDEEKERHLKVSFL